jgi:hypothetical protein
MSITSPVQEYRARPPRPTVGPQIALSAALAVAVAGAALVNRLLPADALLPAVCLLLYLLAALIALIAWHRPSPPRLLSYRDVAGVLTFIGICVSTQVEPEQLVRLVAGAHSQN